MVVCCEGGCDVIERETFIHYAVILYSVIHSFINCVMIYYEP